MECLLLTPVERPHVKELKIIHLESSGLPGTEGLATGSGWRQQEGRGKLQRAGKWEARHFVPGKKHGSMGAQGYSGDTGCQLWDVAYCMSIVYVLSWLMFSQDVASRWKDSLQHAPSLQTHSHVPLGPVWQPLPCDWSSLVHRCIKGVNSEVKDPTRFELFCFCGVFGYL